MTDTILTITDTAKTHIKNFLASSSHNAGFRVSIKKSGCSGYAYTAEIVDTPKATDICTTENDIPLFLDADHLDILQGTTLDFVDKGFGQKQLSFTNPRAKSYCGCGESFTLDNE